MKKILLPEKIIKPGMELLEAHPDIEIVTIPEPTEAEILKVIDDIYGIVLRSKAKVTKKIIENAPKLKIVNRTGAGYDNLDVHACTDHNVMACNLPGVNNISVAEHTVGFLFALMKQFTVTDKWVRNGQWAMRSNFVSSELCGKTLGIIGLGKIGYHVMTLAKAIGMDIIAYDPFLAEKLKDEAKFVDNLDELFENSDAVTIHVPNLPQTKGMVTEELLRKMKPAAFFINTSRGGICDEKSLVKVLEEGKIAGAGIDVFENEPIEADNPLLKMENVILSPHTSGLTRESGYRMTVNAVKNIIDVVEGRLPSDVGDVINAKDLKLI